MRNHVFDCGILTTLISMKMVNLRCRAIIVAELTCLIKDLLSVGLHETNSFNESYRTKHRTLSQTMKLLNIPCPCAILRTPCSFSARVYLDLTWHYLFAVTARLECAVINDRSR